MIDTRAFGAAEAEAGSSSEQRRDKAGKGHHEGQLTRAGQVARAVASLGEWST